MRTSRARRPLLRLSALVTVIGLLTAACASDDPGGGAAADTVSPEEVPEGGTVTVGTIQELTGINGNTSANNALWNRIIMRLVWPTSMRQLPNFTTEPYLLEEEPELVSEDPFVVEWRIREDAVWDDGTPVSSDDFEYFWMACNGRPDPTEPPEGMDCASTTGYDQITTLEKVDEKTVRATFGAPFSIYESLFSEPMPPAHIAAQNGGLAAWGATGYFQDQAGASAGPFRVDNWARGESLTLVRNDRYWGEGPNVDSMVFRFLGATAAEVDALRNGEVDLIYPQPQIDLVETVEGFPSVESSVDFGTTYEHLTFNFDNPLLARLEVRQAIAMGLDREGIVAALMRPFSGEAEVLGNRIYLTNQDEYVDNTPEQFATRDVEGARALLEGIGATAGPDGIYTLDGQRMTLRITTTGGNARREAAEELLINQFADFGIELTTYNLPGADAFVRLADGDFDIALFAWVGTVYPATAVQQLYGTGSDSNFGDYSNPEVDQAGAEVYTELDEEARVDLLNQVDEQLWEDLVSIPLYQLPNFLAYQDDLINVSHNSTTEAFTWNAETWGVRQP